MLAACGLGVALLIGTERADAGQPPDATPPSNTPAPDLEKVWEALEPPLPDPEQRVVRRPAARVRAATNGPSGTEGFSWFRTIASLGAVVGLILLLGWGYRALLSGGLSLPARGRRPGLIEIVSRTALSPKQALCLVRVGPRMVLVGVTPDRLTALDVVEDADLTARLAGESLRRRGESSTREFERCIREQAEGFASAGTDEPPEIDTQQRLEAVRRHLRVRLERLRQGAGIA